MLFEPLKLLQPFSVIVEKMQIQFIDALVIIDLIIKDPTNDRVKERAALRKEEILRHLVVPRYKGLYDFKVGHGLGDITGGVL